MLTQLFAQTGNWTWVILGLALLGLELIAPGTFFMWLGLAALGVGVVAFAVDLPWQVELVLFGVLALAFVFAGRRFFSRHGDQTTDTPGLNERGKAHVGKELTLSEPISGGTGRLKIADTMWRIEGADAAAGTRVRVLEARGATLLVEPVR